MPDLAAGARIHCPDMVGPVKYSTPLISIGVPLITGCGIPSAGLPASAR